MNTAWLDFGIRQIACSSITGYQKYLSPHKGFACAHRILYGGESCSGYIKRIVAEKGLKAGWRASRKRFQDCKAAHQILKNRLCKSQVEEGEAENPKKRQGDDLRWQNFCGDAIADACSGIQCSSDSTDTSCHLLDCGNCLDCTSGLDCSFFDCGGCGS